MVQFSGSRPTRKGVKIKRGTIAGAGTFLEIEAKRFADPSPGTQGSRKITLNLFGKGLGEFFRLEFDLLGLAGQKQ